MRNLLIGLVACCSLCSFAAAPAVKANVKVDNLATAFVTFWDATQDIPSPARVERFKQQVGARFPAFYGIARYNGERTQAEQDARIARVLAQFGPQRAAYLATVTKFDADLPRYIRSFQSTFPDFVPVPIYFLHSLGEMDGGPRDFTGSTILIFGADMMASLHGGDDEGAFFHHELFHTYHPLASHDCPQPGMWLPLWREGLAVYVSKMLDPHATEKEMLLDFPAGALATTKSQMPAAWKQLAQVLDDGADGLYAPLFSTRPDTSGLAPRRGYYLGYLVARELGKTRDIHTLAGLDCSEAHRLVVDTVQALQRDSVHGITAAAASLASAPTASVSASGLQQ